ncbi:MAG: hypothetical protein CFE23_08685 [Flavobacterium sp. BFFFF1]|uniref:FKBP-type peptidyl-prolyl cis-trans isomerase n=1 Tax=unclassified Flavobacterium TaxID=196869 RepID=UPI000BCDA888|nr:MULTISPECIES: hypothetical protein [unclassified Flavobacterium]OYU80552.1 MAG: hypothetical protein CFE23_08685 [Flavobacterium sp. BFFFF1]
MNKFKFYFIAFTASLTLFSCHKNDDGVSIAPPRDSAEQYTTDIDSIETYLKTHYLTVTETDGLQDISIDTLLASNPDGHVSIWDNTEFPLQFKTVKNDVRKTNLVDGASDDAVDYKLYYLILNPGGGENRPTAVDSTFTSYRGWKLDNEEFDRNKNGVWSSFPVLSSTEGSFISGYRQFLSELRPAESVTPNGDGTYTFNNAGVGVVFIPSGLAYFNSSRSGIPAYSPLAFTIRLNTVKYRDHEGDKVLSIYEDLNHNGNNFDDDSDGDNVPDFLDLDDDGDLFLTKDEVRKPTGTPGLSAFYPFNPGTDEPSGIPSCSGDVTTTTRLRKHLDSSCH